MKKCKKEGKKYYKFLIDKLYHKIVGNNQTTTKENIYMADQLSEVAKVAEIQSAYDALKASAVTANATITANNALIASLQAQVAAGSTPSADDINALKAVDALDAEVEADNAPATAPVDLSAPTS